MRTTRNLILIATAVIAVVIFTSAIAGAADPLPSWNDGPAKQSIITFVEKVTKEGSPDFVPLPEHVAVFDNDGTLWCEQPLPVQVFSKHSSITAIDILLEPDAAMLKQAAANNARLLGVFPKGFALDAAHRPHITMLQCFVRTADLDKVYAAEEKVFAAAANIQALKLEAFKYYYAPAGTTGVAGICARPTPEILKLQADIIAAVKPFIFKTGPIGAFTAPHDDPATDAAIIQYVATFVPNMSGEHFNPHVSTGVAPRAYLDRMLAEPFEPFTFSPAGAAVYQLGPFGTAAKKLQEWDLKRHGRPRKLESTTN